ncbi:MAG: hypothetical protein COA78_36380 [Blastopirellula sp.]|nr:MAG: hypothetical protein COA78_36380 [Blastopirellula sp.]
MLSATRKKDREQMQTSIIQSFIGLIGVEGGKAMPTKPVNKDVSGTLFSQLVDQGLIVESEIDMADTSDTELRNELSHESEAKTQPPQINKITKLSEQETPKSEKKTTRSTQESPVEITSSEELALANSTQVTLQETGRRTTPTITENPESLSVAKNSVGKPILFGIEVKTLQSQTKFATLSNQETPDAAVKESKSTQETLVQVTTPAELALAISKQIVLPITGLQTTPNVTENLKVLSVTKNGTGNSLPLGTDVKILQHQISKFATSSNHEVPDIVRKTSSYSQEKPTEITSSAELALVISKQITIPETGRHPTSNFTESPESLSGAKNGIGKPLPLLSPALEVVSEQTRQPTHIEFRTQNLRRIQYPSQTNVTDSPGTQIPQTVDPDAPNNNLQAQFLGQAFSKQPTGNSSGGLAQFGIQIPTEQNELRPPAPKFEQVKEFGSKPINDDRLRYSVPPKPVEWSITQATAQSAMPITHGQTLPSTSTTIPITSFAAETPETTALIGEIIDEFMPAAETEMLGRLNVGLNLPPIAALDSTRASIVRFAGAQMVDALVRQPDQPIEVALNPEELGRVRIALTHLDSGLSVTITAERPETLDLMRRHIEQLAAEFRQLGYDNIGFEFFGGDANSSGQSETENQPSLEQMADIPDPETLSPVSLQTTSLDIRL